MTAYGFTRPSHARLAELFDEHLQAGDEIRYSDERQLVVWSLSRIGVWGWIGLIALGLVTAFIVPAIILIVLLVQRRGRLTTYAIGAGGKLTTHSRSTR